MDLKEIKRIAAYARRAGIKHLAIDGLALEFHDAPRVARTRKPAVSPDTRPAPPPEPTLEQINDYIYGDTEEKAG